MIEADRINSTFYALRLLSHQLALGEVEISAGTEYPATEFTVDEQLSAFEILRKLGADAASDTLSQEQIQAHLDALASDIEELANSVLAEAGYDIDVETPGLVDTDAMSEPEPLADPMAEQVNDHPAILKSIFTGSLSQRAQALWALGHRGGPRAFELITASFDDPDQAIRDAAVRALIDSDLDHAATFTRALREASEGRRRRITAAIVSSGLAQEYINELASEVRERAYHAFSMLFLMVKAGEWEHLFHAIEDHPTLEARLAVIRLLTLVAEPHFIPKFSRLADRGSLPAKVRSALMDAIFEIKSKASAKRPSVA